MRIVITILLGLMALAMLPATLAQEADVLAGTQWRLVSLDGETVLDGTAITLLFDLEGQAAGSAGCNSYGGSYTVDGDEVGFDALISTMMACADDIMAQETAYLTALQAAARYELDEDRLSIETREDATLVFAPLPTLVDTTWRLVSLDDEPVRGTLTLAFDALNRISGEGGCNGFGGNFSATAGAITMEVISTLMACMDDDLTGQEAAYFAALQGSTAYDLSQADQLTLTTADGIVLVFARLHVLAGTAWQLVSLDEAGLVEGSTVTLAFDDAGGLSGSGGCNSYSASYTSDGETLSIGPVVSTKMACMDAGVMEQEAAFFAALSQAVSYTVVDDQLIVTYGTGQTMMFAPVEVTGS